MPKGNKPGEPHKYKNISVDADLVEAINQIADDLKERLGFRPSISNTIRYLIKKGAN